MKYHSLREKNLICIFTKKRNKVVHYNIKVYGLVQGVSFRKHTMNQARVLGINGFVKNMLDGSVYIEAEGPVEALDKLVDWCHQGPRFAKVTSVHVETDSIKNYESFTLKY